MYLNNVEKNKITVMHLINYYTLAGAEKLTFEITSKMDKAKFNVFVCSVWSKEGDDIELSIRSDLQKQEVRTLSFLGSKDAVGDFLRSKEIPL